MERPRLKVPLDAPKIERPRLKKPINLGRGHPTFEATSYQRELVKALCACGAKVDEIAKLIINPDTGKPIHYDTLKNVFFRELELGVLEQHLKITNSLYEMAVGRDAVYDDKGNLLRAPLAPNLGAIVWWEKTRRGFKEGVVLTHQDPNGKPLQGAQVVVVLPPNGRESPTTLQIPHQRLDRMNGHDLLEEVPDAEDFPEESPGE
jgi:hypothetical protein